MNKKEKLIALAMICESDHCGCMANWIEEQLQEILGKDYRDKYNHLHRKRS